MTEQYPPKPAATGNPGENAQWEQDLLRRFAFESLREQRAARRWGIFFKLLIFVYIIALLAMSMPRLSTSGLLGTDRITALVDVEGIIAQGGPAGADNVVTGLRAAFENETTAGVIIRINSPGGSPVQAGYINDEIYRLKKKYPDTKVYAVIQDICASGGYYVAAAADEIYADKGSIVGSIGVRMDSFGFVDAMEKLGVERRLLTAGDHKGFLDPFLPLDQQEVSHVTGLLKEIHAQFIRTVERGRGKRLKPNPDLFTGLVWTGERALEIGLIDALGSAGHVARDVIKAEDIVDFTPQENVLDQVARRFGARLALALREGLAGLW